MMRLQKRMRLQRRIRAGTINRYFFCLFFCLIYRFYGCGLTIPSHVEGLQVLDLGSGTGRDCFVMSKLVGENGSVVGVDMTDNQVRLLIKRTWVLPEGRS